MNRMVLAALGLVVLAPCAGAEVGPWNTPSPLALARVDAGTPPRLILAQRVIEREWGLSDDSIYVEKEVPGLRSEAAAMLMSAAVPGAGQYYSDGSAMHAAWFALAEALGWTARIVLRRGADRARDDAAAFAGTPNDSTSTWSVARWVHATESNPANIEELYAADKEAFYDLIGTDPRFLAGWNGDAQASRQHFVELRDTSERRLHGARWAESVLWVNHVVSAFDALRAARNQNLKISPALGLKIKSGWRHGSPELAAVITRRF